ncbi:Pol polyprotein [Plakobranchus ocellatus]|uniref:Pol polyprotein n=1 Tax=Plakobranchus ocellatus TaxID=259542 RepID=A0AAV4BVL4_9GAST|nr:Pol polyprotein [Plakobranchus ocellatus]
MVNVATRAQSKRATTEVPAGPQEVLSESLVDSGLTPEPVSVSTATSPQILSQPGNVIDSQCTPAAKTVTRNGSRLYPSEEDILSLYSDFAERQRADPTLTSCCRRVDKDPVRGISYVIDHGYLYRVFRHPGLLSISLVLGPYQAIEYILTLIDVAIRYAETVPLKRITAIDVADELFSIFTRLGFPLDIQSDNGPQFISGVLKELNVLAGVKHVFSTPFHPQTNAVVGRFHGTLKNMLRKLSRECPTCVDAYNIPLPEDLFGQLANSTVFSSCGLSRAYCQVPLSPDCRRITAFQTPLGLMQWVRVPFGLVNALQRSP